MAPSDTEPETGGKRAGGAPKENRRRSLRAVFAADIAGFSGRMSLNETNTVNVLTEILSLGREALARHDGCLFGMPGDGLFATFESGVSAVQCALELQADLAARSQLSTMPLRIGIHLGEVIIKDDIPYGETLNIAARLESLADRGGILVSGTVMDAVASRLSATFEARGIPQLKNIPRRIPTFAVKPPPARTLVEQDRTGMSTLDQTTRLDGGALSGNAESAQPGSGAAPSRSPQPSPVPPSPLPRVMATAASSEHLPLDQIARAARDAAAAREASLNRLLGEGAANTDVPAASGTADDPKAQPRQAAQPSPEFIDRITKALAEHIGPFARMIVQKQLGQNFSTFELISALEQQVPSENERVAFRVKAAEINRSLGGDAEG